MLREGRGHQVERRSRALWRWRWSRRIVGGGHDGGKQTVAWTGNGHFGQRIRSASFPLTSTLHRKYESLTAMSNCLLGRKASVNDPAAKVLAPRRRGENVGRKYLESVLGASNLMLVVAHSDWSGSLCVERWPRSISTINCSHPRLGLDFHCGVPRFFPKNEETTEGYREL